MEHHLQLGVGKIYILDDGSQASADLEWPAIPPAAASADMLVILRCIALTTGPSPASLYSDTF